MSMFSLHITTPTTHLAWSCPNQGDAAEHAFPKKQMSLGPGFIRCCFFKWDSMGFQNTKRVSIIQHHPPTEKNEAKRRMFQVVGSPRRARSGSCYFCRRSQCHAGTELRTSIGGTASAVFMDLLIFRMIFVGALMDFKND